MKNKLITIINGLKLWVDNRIKNSRSDWNENDKSSNSYIKNKPFYEEITYKTLIPKTTVNITSEYESLPDTPLLTVGQTYRVILNGVEYICVARWYDDYECMLIGNGGIYGDGVSNGEPFCCDSYDDGNFYLNVNIPGEYTFSLEKVTVDIKKIDEKYLPDNIGGKPDWNQNDETASDYIKNRPFGIKDVEPITINHGDMYNYDNKVEIKGISVVRSSDIVITDMASIIGGKIESNKPGYDFIVTEENITKDDNCIYVSGEFTDAIFVFNSFDDISTGVYLGWMASIQRTVTSFTTSGKETVCIDEKYIPDEVRVESISYNISKGEQFRARNNIGISEHNFPELIITDKVTGYSYIISMIDKKIVYESLCDGGIYVAQMPIQTIYGVNDTIDKTNGLIIAAECEDGSIKEIVNYTSTISNDGIVTITYIENGKEYTTTFTVEVIDGLEDFYYADNGDGTVTITGWKGTLNGISSTEIVFPNDSRVIL